ncbi:MAG: peptidoglycan DD-metalloendopeptidase family protein [Devosiaceae bacterium]|nr:peptidoglycan DD-metalloendopeptidase family protein [Devosiaceae bacterium]
MFSKQPSKKLIIRAISISTMIVAATSLSGCVIGDRSLGGAGIDYSIATAATNTVSGNQNQSMPGSLGSPLNNDILVATSPVKYLPPANIGNLIEQGANQISAPIVNSNVLSSNLPALTKPINSNSLNSLSNRSTNNMPAQTMQTPIMQQPVQSNVTPTLVAKTPANSYFHTIESGESLFSIARKYNVTVTQIVSANGLSSADKIGVGQKVAIPGRSDLLVAKAPVKTPVAVVQAVPAPKAEPKPAPVVAQPVQKPAPVVTKTATATNSDKFRWPANGKVIVDFAGSKNTGINIAVAEGSAIRAAATGTVIYVGSAVEGYGNLILIKHENGYVSAYAHLSQITTAKGDIVQRGDAIGLAGQTGSVTSSQLHFELRKGATPVDPIPMLAG